jgi:hypothetical protein
MAAAPDGEQLIAELNALPLAEFGADVDDLRRPVLDDILERRAPSEALDDHGGSDSGDDANPPGDADIEADSLSRLLTRRTTKGPPTSAAAACPRVSSGCRPLTWTRRQSTSILEA